MGRRGASCKKLLSSPNPSSPQEPFTAQQAHTQQSMRLLWQKPSQCEGFCKFYSCSPIGELFQRHPSVFGGAFGKVLGEESLRGAPSFKKGLLSRSFYQQSNLKSSSESAVKAWMSRRSPRIEGSKPHARIAFSICARSRLGNPALRALASVLRR